MTTHAARIEASPRLRRVLRALSDGPELSTMDLSLRACQGLNLALHSAVLELKQNGIPVECEQRGRRWFYHIPPEHLASARARLDAAVSTEARE